MHKALIVDDDSVFAEILQQILEEQKLDSLGE